MRILAIVTDAFGSGGGIARYNCDLLQALAANKAVDKVQVLPRFGTQPKLSTGVTQLPAVKNKLAYAAKALKLSFRFRPNIIFCGHIGLVPVAWIISKWCRCPLWLQIHGIDAWQPVNTIQRRMINSAALVTAVSRYTRRRFLSWARNQPNSVRVLPNTVDESFFSTPNNIETEVSEYSMDRHPILLTVGRLSSAEAYKGHDRVIRCLPELRKNYPEITYIIAGEGDDRKRLETLSEKLNVTGNTKFIGRVPDEQLPTLYKSADLFVMPSTGEGFGIVFLEAMASDTPALGLDCDGSRDPLRDGELGVLANEKTLCDTIGQALRAKPEKNLPARVQHYFGLDAFRSQLDLILMQFRLSGSN